MIVKYFKKRKANNKKGVMVAIPIEQEGIVKFGYSLCHTKLDKFDKDLGKKIAIDRALCDRAVSIPESMEKEFKLFKTRCKKYYKQLEVG